MSSPAAEPTPREVAANLQLARQRLAQLRLDTLDAEEAVTSLELQMDEALDRAGPGAGAQ